MYCSLSEQRLDRVLNEEPRPDRSLAWRLATGDRLLLCQGEGFTGASGKSTAPCSHGFGCGKMSLPGAGDDRWNVTRHYEQGLSAEEKRRQRSGDRVALRRAEGPFRG